MYKGKKVAIITVTYNEAGNLKDFFLSVKRQTFKNLSVIVFDNNSKDGSPEITKKLYPDAIILKSNKNIGFASAMNIAYKRALKIGVDFVFLLNNDVKFNKTCVEELVKLSENKNAVLVGPLLLKWHGDENIIQTYGGDIDVDTGKMTKYYANQIYDNKIIPRIKKVSFISGGISLINVNLIRNRKDLFDERYFLYTEEFDLETDLKKENKVLYVTTKSKVWHKIHNRSIFQKYRELFYINRNLYLYFYKYFGFSRVFQHFLVQMYKFPSNSLKLLKNFGLLMVWTLFIANIIGFLNIKGKVSFDYLERY